MSTDTIQPSSDTERPTALYSPGLLALAVGLAGFPYNPAHPLRAQARSRVCGSVVETSLAVDSAFKIEAVGLRTAACAVGQAAAALFAQHATGKTAGELKDAHAAIGEWLAGGAAMPSWPGLAVLEPALRHSARHAAILLPWEAAISALLGNGKCG